MMKNKEATNLIAPENIDTKPFCESRYPRAYQPSFHNKVFGWIFVFFFVFLCMQLLMLFKNTNKYYELIAIALIVIVWLYVEVIKVRFGYKVQLYADRVQLNYLFCEKTMLRKDIETCEYWGGRLAMVKINQTKYGGFFVRTLGEFEKDDDFIDWFNSLNAEIIEPIPNKFRS